MNLIDPRTVILLTGVMSGLMSLVLYVLKRTYPPSIKGLGQWSAALLLLFVGGLMVAARGQLPDLISISGSSLLLWCGLYLAYVGTQRFFGIQAHVWPWMALIVGILPVHAWFTVVEPNYHMRMVVSTGLTALLSAVHAYAIWKQRAFTFARALAIGVLLFLCAIQLMRLLTANANPLPDNAEFFDASTAQVIYITSFSFTVLLFSISLVLMATDRLRTELEHLATHDSLTNALTRRHMNEFCEQELERCRRHGRSVAVLLMDLDHFKVVNDTYGHHTGDRALVNFVTKVNAALRRPDQLGRFGGEEFVAILPETSLEEAVSVAERIREFCAEADPEPYCTVSIGVTTNQKDSDTLETLMKRADAAMYRAKANGRNRIEAA